MHESPLNFRATEAQMTSAVQCARRHAFGTWWPGVNRVEFAVPGVVSATWKPQVVGASQKQYGFFRSATIAHGRGLVAGGVGKSFACSGQGGSPPLRFRVRRNALRSSRPFLSAKKRSVSIAAIFLAAATTRNGFRLLPTRWVISSSAAFMETGEGPNRLRLGTEE